MWGAKSGPTWGKRSTRTCKLTSQELAEKLSNVQADDPDEDASQSDSVAGKKKNATSRSSAKRVAPVLGKFCDAKKKLLQQIGFEDSVHIPGINKMDRAYTTEVLMRIDCDKRELNIDANTKIKLVETDVKRVFGCPNGNKKVSGLESDTPEDALDFIRLCIGTGAMDAYNSLEAAERNITREYSLTMSRQEAENFQVSFVVWIMNRFYAPSCQPNSGYKTFWGALLDPDEIAGYNWCGYILDCTIEAARKAQYDMAAKKCVSNVGGCPLFIQVLALDFIRHESSQAPPRLLPIVADYDCELMAKLIQAHRHRMASVLPKGPEDVTLAEFLTEVGNAKIDLQSKVALRRHMAQLLKINSQERDNLIRHAISLVRSLSAAMASNSVSTAKEEPNKWTAEGYASGSESVTDGPRDKTGGSKRKFDYSAFSAPGPSYSKRTPILPVGNLRQMAKSTTIINNDQTEQQGDSQSTGNQKEMAKSDTDLFGAGVDAPATTTINKDQTEQQVDGQSTGTLKANLGTDEDGFPSFDLGLDDLDVCIVKDALKGDNTTVGTNEPEQVQETYPNTKPYSPNTVFSQDLGPDLNQEPVHTPDAGGAAFTTPANLTKVASSNSPGTINRLYSETAVVFRLFEPEEEINLNGRSLEDEFTMSPVCKKECPPARLEKSPWSKGISHPKRETALTGKFYDWLEATTGPDINRAWIMHCTERYIEVTGFDLKNIFCRQQAMSYDLFDIAIRRICELDNRMYTNKEVNRWRHIMESDFAMLAVAGEDPTTNKAIRHQFLGKSVKHAIQACRMITVPAMVRTSWCVYFWDMKIKCVHVADPTYKTSEAASFEQIHKPNLKVLTDALSKCAKMFFDGWCPEWESWEPRYITPVSPAVQEQETGIRTLQAICDFNGSTFITDNHMVTSKDLNQWMLHEVLCLSGNCAKLPGSFVQTIDD